MFYRSREEVLKVVTKLRRSHCSYDMGPRLAGDSEPLMCDCKYGGEGIGDSLYMGEQTGCPELRCVEALLSSLTDVEYNETMVSGVGGIQV